MTALASDTEAMALADALEERVRRVTGPGAHPLHAPEFSGREWKYVKDCLDTGWVSSVGAYVDRFEAEVARAAGTRHGVAVVNGTAALEVALRLVGVGPGDEVLMPSLSFVATANAALHAGAVPHFVDASPETLGLCPRALAERLDRVARADGGAVVNRATGRRIAAVVPMHCFGHPADMNGISEAARAWGLPVVEDAAEALGSLSHGRPCGSLGRIAALSFNGNKTLTTGGGGAIVTDDPDLAARAKHLTTTAKAAHPWAFVHDEPGFNYRMPNLNAALGVAQLEQLADRLAKKRALAALYAEAFADFEDATLKPEPAGCRSNHWLNAFLLSPGAAPQRNAVLDALNGRGLQVRPVWEPLHRLAFLSDAPRGDLSVTEDLAARIVCLPSSAALGDRR